MAYQIVLKKRFINQLYKLLLYLEENWGYAVAAEFQKNIDTHSKLLEQQPNIGKTTAKVNARSILITPHNRIVYKISGDKIIIITMYDTRMNPKKNRYR
jgi:plasmid stabilization system protein ParE